MSRKKNLHILFCITCHTKLGVSPHNFADKMIFCSKECYIKGDELREKYWRD